MWVYVLQLLYYDWRFFIYCYLRRKYNICVKKSIVSLFKRLQLFLKVINLKSDTKRSIPRHSEPDQGLKKRSQGMSYLNIIQANYNWTYTLAPTGKWKCAKARLSLRYSFWFSLVAAVASSTRSCFPHRSKNRPKIKFGKLHILLTRTNAILLIY